LALPAEEDADAGLIVRFELVFEAPEEVIESGLVLGENNKPLVFFPLLTVAEVLRYDFQQPVEPGVCDWHPERRVCANESETVKSVIDRRNFIGEFRQEWFQPGAHRLRGMVRAALDFAVVVKIFFEGPLSSLYRRCVGNVAVCAIKELVPRFSESEG
jgi:hypothetical protein